MNRSDIGGLCSNVDEWYGLMIYGASQR